MKKPRALDLFCAGGGMAKGLHDAGFDVFGIDIKRQPYYPYDFVQADAFAYLREHGGEFDFIHGSPPCQGYSYGTRKNSKWVSYSMGKDTPKLIEPFRDILLKVGRPYCIENVGGARDYLMNPVELCGSMFRLYIPRHRYFETSFHVDQPIHPNCHGMAKENAAKLGFEYRDMTVTGKGRHAGTSQRWSFLLGITWPMSQVNLAESIPPVYGKYIGEYAMEAV